MRAGLDYAVFGAIRVLAAGASFLGALYLLAAGRAEAFGAFLVALSLSLVVAAALRLGADRTLVRLSRRPVAAAEARDPRARVYRTWLPAAALALLAAAALWPVWSAGAFYLSQGAVLALLHVTGRFLRACGRPRPAVVVDPGMMPAAGTLLLCAGFSAPASLALGGVLLLTLSALAIRLAVPASLVAAVLRARPRRRVRARRLVEVYQNYAIELAFRDGVNLALAWAVSPVALAQFRTLMKLNFVIEQAQEFQKQFRIGAHRAEWAELAPRAGALARALAALGRSLPAAPARDAAAARARVRLAETLGFAGAALALNLVVMTLLLDYPFTAMPPAVFLLILTGLQAASLWAGPAIFVIMNFRSVAIANAISLIWTASFLTAALLVPPLPEIWVLLDVGLLAAARLAARRLAPDPRAPAPGAPLGDAHARRA